MTDLVCRYRLDCVCHNYNIRNTSAVVKLPEAKVAFTTNNNEQIHSYLS